MTDELLTLPPNPRTELPRIDQTDDIATNFRMQEAIPKT